MTNALLQGLLLGGYYALLAAGLSFLFGVMRIINLAHGSLAVVAAFALWLLADRHGLDPFLMLPVVMVPMAFLGWLLYRLVFARSLRGGALTPILASFGLATVVDNALFQGFGADTRSLAPYIGDLAYESWALPGDIFVGQLAVLVFATSLAVLGGLQLMLSATTLGRRIRAAAEDADAAGLVGVDTHRIYGIATAISLATVTLAGLAMALRATFDPYAGPSQLIFAFEAVVIGGAGSLWGTLAGGVILGIAQSVGAHINPQGFLLAGHGVFLAILVFRVYGGPALATRWRNLKGAKA